MDGAIKIAFIDPIKEYWPTNTPKISNYDNFNMDMGEDRFEWRQTRVADGSVKFTNKFLRGAYDFGGFGAYPFYTATSTTASPLLWVMTKGFASGNFDSPALYYDSPVNSDGVISSDIDALRQPRWYETDISIPEFVQETWQQTSRRRHRHIMDAITNSAPSGKEGVVPWIAIPGYEPLYNENAAFIGNAGIDETRRTLALLRSKDVREAIMFATKSIAGGRGEADKWANFVRADAQVFTPTYDLYEVTRGVDLHPSDNGHPGALMTTLRGALPRERVEIAAEPVDGQPNLGATEIIVTINSIYPYDNGLNGRIVLECSLKPVIQTEIGNLAALANWTAGVSGYVSIWNINSSMWEPLSTVHDYNSQSEGQYFFYTPDASTRREWVLYDGSQTDFDFCNYIVIGPSSCSGSIMLKFTHVAQMPPSGFVSSYDLVQFYHIDLDLLPSYEGEDPIPLGLMSGSSINADFDFNGEETAADASGFVQAWTNGLPAGDYNGDGEVEAIDLTQFMNAIAE